ncbi:MAG TPA: zf-HC2 domain-containing protein [Azonexus sp.]|nr:zf-HC2 domain-containing protein [Azonexus sp.]
MLSCKEVTHLLSESQDRKLSVSERVHLEMHLAICKGCKNFKNQMTFLRKACQRYVKNRGNIDD